MSSNDSITLGEMQLGASICDNFAFTDVELELVIKTTKFILMYITANKQSFGSIIISNFRQKLETYEEFLRARKEK